MYRVALLLLILCTFAGSGSWPVIPVAQAQGPELTAARLNEELGSRLERVPEFLFIREQAEKLGVKAYLFGGTAAAYSHYVKEDLLREAGDTRFPAFRFDYDYTNIFRSTQDLDVVIDGSAEQAQALETALKERYPHFVGEKAQWEIRPLRVARGSKEAILNNPDFANQHTDSHSTGLVEITKPDSRGLTVRDVRDWDNQKNPQFLQDVIDGKLHYYFSPSHALTSRAKAGLNPPILSAIRYLTKAFQYGLEISGEDRARIKKIIEEMRPEELENDYVKDWMEKNGKKLIQHALDIERAWNELEDLGLRKKLIAIQNSASTPDSMAWWLNKEPLRTKPLGEGAGRTAAEIAKELGQKSLIVAHEANSFLAWESISRDRGGALNALISRGNAVGEAARFGDGFYTRIGQSGARGTGFTIRMELDPRAREGADFIRSDEFIILRNKNAARVIPEQIKMSLSAFIRHLAEGKEFSKDDKALLEKMKRSIAIQVVDEEINKTLAILRENFALAEPSPTLMWEWFSIPASSKYPELVEALVKKGVADRHIAAHVLSQAHWKNHPEWVEALIKKGTADHQIATEVLSQAHWKNHPEWVEALIKKGTVDHQIAKSVLSQAHWRNRPEWVVALLKKGKVDHSIAYGVLSQAHWKDHPEWVETLLKRGTADKEIAAYVLSQAHWKDHPEWVEALLNKGTADREIAEDVLSQAHWKDHPEWVEALIKKGTVDWEIARSVLSKAHWKDHPEWVEALIKKGTVDEYIAAGVLSKAHWKDHPEWLEVLIKNGKADTEIVHFVLSQAHWKNHPDLRKIAGGEPTLENLRAAFAKNKTLYASRDTMRNICQRIFKKLTFLK